MATMDEIRQLQQAKQPWVECDPVTLVTAARQAVYGGVLQQTSQPGQQQQQDVIGPLEEVITRFEQQTRASLGASFVESSRR